MVIAYLLVNTEDGKENRVAELLMNFPFVKNVHVARGKYSLIAEMEGKDELEIHGFVINHVKRIPDISFTTTLVSD